ncbi:MAG TPA: hypothetical protein DCM62_07880 [Bacteroidales bacterium]|nr:hypothetical protein [Bacteroidales bacterium]
MSLFTYISSKLGSWVLISLMVLAVSCQGGTNQPLAHENIAEQAATEGMPEITFEKSQHDFGKITSGEVVAYSFSFTNTGNAPLLILDTHSGCVCTVGEYPNQPIAPGGKGTIEVIYNSAGRSGLQIQIIRVITNTAQQETILQVAAEVLNN